MRALRRLGGGRALLFTALLLEAMAAPLLAADSNGIQVEELARSSASWNGQALPDYPEGRPEVSILRITIPPGTLLPLHEHPVINAGVLLEGQLLVETVSGEKLRLLAGDPIIELVDTPHSGLNDGDEAAVIIVFYAGVEGRPITVTRP